MSTEEINALEVSPLSMDEDAATEVAAYSSNPSEGFLFKVPAAQRRENPEAYEPIHFFIGPYQYATLVSDSARAAASLDGEHLKKKAAKAMLEEGRLQELQLKIKDQYSEIQDVYAQMTPEQWEAISGKEKSSFAERLAFDAVMVVTIFDILDRIGPTSFAAAPQDPAHRNPPGFFSVPIAYALLRDALLVENQVPLKVLRYAFEIWKAPDRYCDFEEGVVREYCSNVWEQHFNIRAELHVARWPNVRRESRDCLLGAIYDSLTPPSNSQDDEHPKYESEPFSRLLTASHLERCGIRCRMRSKEPPVLSSITCNEKKRVIELPQIRVGEETLTFLHNLIAYETSCRFPKKCFVVSYVSVMDLLINTEEDVQVLVKANIIHNGLGSHAELATAWNKLVKSVTICFTEKDYQTLNQVHDLAKSRWRRWIAEFKWTFWEKKPWLVISIVAAAILLALTFLQTVFTIKDFNLALTT